jgi:hypothetical protein
MGENISKSKQMQDDLTDIFICMAASYPTQPQRTATKKSNRTNDHKMD